MTSPSSPRVAAVLAHFGPRYICPFATQSMRNNALSVCELAESLPATLERLGPALRQFIAARQPQPGSSLVLLFPSDVLAEAAFLQQGQNLFLILHFLLAMGAEPSRDPEDAAAEAQTAMTESFDPAHPIRTFLSFGGSPIASIALGPIYPVQHTRFAPHDCFVLTWFEDVAQVPTAARDKIRAAIVAQMGELYDADDLVVPLSALRR